MRPGREPEARRRGRLQPCRPEAAAFAEFRWTGAHTRRFRGRHGRGQGDPEQGRRPPPGA